MLCAGFDYDGKWRCGEFLVHGMSAGLISLLHWPLAALFGCKSLVH